MRKCRQQMSRSSLAIYDRPFRDRGGFGDIVALHIAVQLEGVLSALMLNPPVRADAV
jgi:hypothetical protein